MFQGIGAPGCDCRLQGSNGKVGLLGCGDMMENRILSDGVIGGFKV